MTFKDLEDNDLDNMIMLTMHSLMEKGQTVYQITDAGKAEVKKMQNELS